MGVLTIMLFTKQPPSHQIFLFQLLLNLTRLFLVDMLTSFITVETEQILDQREEFQVYLFKNSTNITVPAIWFLPGTTKLLVRVATTANNNDGIESSVASLPLNEITNVRVEAFGRTVFLFLNNKLDSMKTLSADRISGAATLYISDPWYSPANADIGSIKMETLVSKAASIFNTPRI